MLSFCHRGSTQSSSATWPTALTLPTCGGPMTTASWWRWAGGTHASWSGPMSPRATGNSNSATARSRTSRARTTEVRRDFLFWFFIWVSVAWEKVSIAPVSRQVTTATWRERTRSPTPSRPYPATCDPWPVWNPTCSWRSPLWMKGISNEAVKYLFTRAETVELQPVIVQIIRPPLQNKATPAFFSQHTLPVKSLRHTNVFYFNCPY